MAQRGTLIRLVNLRYIVYPSRRKAQNLPWKTPVVFDLDNQHSGVFLSTSQISRKPPPLLGLGPFFNPAFIP
jgi:hypothetical protein